jgi:regulator of replication initiation timing
MVGGERSGGGAYARRVAEDPTGALLAEADALYALPLGEFTAARDARAKELKRSEAELSRAVKALPKPSLAAWVVNLLVRRETEQVEQVLEVGAALRQAQAGMDAEELRALTRQRRQLTAAVTGRARARASEAGQRVTQAVADQVEATLTAAMVDAGCAAAVRSGQLVTALAATGVDEVDVASAVATPAALGFVAAPCEAAPVARPDLRVVPDPEADARRRREARREAEEQLTEAEEALEAASGEADEARAAVAELQARGMQLQAELDELRRRIADLEAQAEEVDEELEEAEAIEEEAREAVEGARRERDEAAAALDRLA